jgi:ABC-type transport system involved in cytochrome c biogenesis permease subunit
MPVAERTMATSEILRPDVVAARPNSTVRSADVSFNFATALNALASLRLTVVLFALSIFLVFMGTLAQVDHGVWDVVNHLDFRVWVARIDFVAFERLVHMFYPVNWQLTGGFYFPGGKLLGGLLLANLLAAHTMRFKVNATGQRLRAGLALIALGALITLLVVRSGMNDTLGSELSPTFCSVLWYSLLAALTMVVFAGAHLLNLHRGSRRRAEWWLLACLATLLGALAIWLFFHPDARLDDSGLRILWQLVKGLVAGGVLLAGCILAFRKRAGVVLLHGGVALMMCSELLTGITANEAQMTIAPGATANYSEDSRSAELAVIDHSAADTDRLTVVPETLLKANVGAESLIMGADLPFDVRVLRWLPNSKLQELGAGEKSAASDGAGRRYTVEELSPVTGVEKNPRPDAPSAYVELFSKQGGQSLGTFLVSQWLKEQPIDVDGHAYDLALRYKHAYYPYSLTLKKFSYDRYTGTNTAKNYSSLVQLKDPTRNVDREVLIWMNNPLRYAGNTFYQQSFDEDTETTTVLQVVANPGWMMPYVGCMFVATGMLFHFGGTLTRFLRRRADEAVRASAPQDAISRSNAMRRNNRRSSVLQPAGSSSRYAKPTFWFPVLVVAIFAFYLADATVMPKSAPNEMQIYKFGKLPVSYQGRIKPYDTMALNALQVLSGKQEVVVTGKNGSKSTLPAIRWLLDLISRADAEPDYRVFRIEDLELLQVLGLEPRPGDFRYSFTEINKQVDEFTKQVDLATAQPQDARSQFQEHVLQLAKKREIYIALALAYSPPPFSTEKDKFAESLQKAQSIIAQLQANEAPHGVPPQEADGKWIPLMEAELQLLRDRVTNKPINPATVALASMIEAYGAGDAATFNKELFDFRGALAEYERALSAHHQEVVVAGVAKSEILSQPKINFEVFYNQFSPFYYAAVLYLVAFVLGICSWLGWMEPLRRASIWLICFTLAVHTFALVGRIYISGRPPVTNLYSSAVFIGWAGVVLSLVFESIYRLGLGNIVAAVIGFLTLLVAHFLSLDGDTFTVLLAVLDTQFWLATHVVCITLGYTTTFLAGAFGVVYILAAYVFHVLSEEQRRQVTRMIYGTLCFAIFFSFVGTVLGGLWADDSWGRFWGWDPKENGALIIVLYNALVLHARWGGMVGGRGLALLTIGGNIVTAWSWFGVNALGVGLHSYGFDSTIAMWLLTFAASQAALIVVGALPQQWWRSIIAAT